MGDDAVDNALGQIPGLRGNVPTRKIPTVEDYFITPEGEEDDPSVAKKAVIEDSDAVQAALNQIPGLRQKLGG